MESGEPQETSRRPWRSPVGSDGKIRARQINLTDARLQLLQQNNGGGAGGRADRGARLGGSQGCGGTRNTPDKPALGTMSTIRPQNRGRRPGASSVEGIPRKPAKSRQTRGPAWGHAAAGHWHGPARSHAVAHRGSCWSQEPQEPWEPQPPTDDMGQPGATPPPTEGTMGAGSRRGRGSHWSREPQEPRCHPPKAPPAGQPGAGAPIGQPGAAEPQVSRGPRGLPPRGLPPTEHPGRRSEAATAKPATSGQSARSQALKTPKNRRMPSRRRASRGTGHLQPHMHNPA